MHSQQHQELIESIRSISSLDAFWEKISQALSEYGVNSMFYGAASSKNELQFNKTKSLILKCDHPKEFEEYFGLDTLINNCKTFEHSLKETKPCIWHDERYWFDATDEQRAQALIEREMGLHVGFTLPTTHFSANNWGGHGICMGELDPKEFSKLWDEKKQEIIKILGVLDAGMRQNYLGQIVKLSPREKQTLEYLTVGFTPDQIADYLGISSSTIDKYIVSSKRKLNARTRDHAVSKALLMNVIHP